MSSSLTDRLYELAEPSHPGKNLPYQSIFRNGVLLMRGERTDLMERHSLIPWEDIKGKSVLDIGTNIGGSALLAMESGAGIVTGIDRSPECVQAATQIAKLLGFDPDFRVEDASAPSDGLPEYDTAFCFSVLRHCDARPSMRKAKVVILETNIRDDGAIPREIAEEWRTERLDRSGPRRLYRLERR